MGPTETYTNIKTNPNLQKDLVIKLFHKYIPIFKNFYNFKIAVVKSDIIIIIS